MNTTSKVGLKGLTDKNTLGRDIMKGSYVNFEFPHSNIQENKTGKNFPDPDIWSGLNNFQASLMYYELVTVPIF